jgi:hypothetical protein
LCAQTTVTTWHYDNLRTGANINETKLTPANVNFNQFGKLFTQSVDGAIIGQALYLSNVRVAGKGRHNVVYVATMHDGVYAFDADNATGQNASPLWYTTFLSPGVVPVPIELQGCGRTTSWTEVGITSTGVIDPVAGSLFVVAKTYENNGFVYRLHVLDVTSGSEKSGSPVVLSGTFQSQGMQYDLVAAGQVNRPALLLDNGTLYIALGSNGCRTGREQGWVLAYDSSTLQLTGVFDDEPGIAGGGIWQKGGGLSADGAHYVYAETADGPFIAGSNFGESIFKLSPVTVNLADWFTPYNQEYLTRHDLDMTAPPLVLPDQPGKYPHLALAVGKEGTIYVLNRDNMGQFCSNCKLRDNQIVEELPGIAGKETGNLVFWNNQVYTTPVNEPVTRYALSNGRVLRKPLAQSAGKAGRNSPVLSANGTNNGILWQTGRAKLSAFDATSLSLLYSTAQAPNGRDELPSLPHFANVMVTNGKVYVGTYNTLVVLGSLQ